MKVREAMHKGVDWVGPDTSVSDLAKLMRQHDIGAIPIGENDRLIGMVTDRDIVCKGLAKNGFNPSRATARDVQRALVRDGAGGVARIRLDPSEPRQRRRIQARAQTEQGDDEDDRNRAPEASHLKRPGHVNLRSFFAMNE